MNIYDPISIALNVSPMFFDFDHLSENYDKISSVFAGKKHTEETLSILRVPKSEEHKRKIGLGNKGKHGPEAALIASKAAAKVNKGKKRPDHAEKIKKHWESGTYKVLSGEAHSRYGKKHSEETKAKIRAAILSKKNAR